MPYVRSAGISGVALVVWVITVVTAIAQSEASSRHDEKGQGRIPTLPRKKLAKRTLIPRRQIRRAKSFGMKWNERAFWSACKLLKIWWPGTESNRRRQPFQGCALR